MQYGIIDGEVEVEIFSTKAAAYVLKN